jgi:hypothetical protein
MADVRILDDATYGKYADACKALLATIRQDFVGKKVRIENYNTAINGRTGQITDVRIVEGSMYFCLDGGGMSFEPAYLTLVIE